MLREPIDEGGWSSGVFQYIKSTQRILSRSNAKWSRRLRAVVSVVMKKEDMQGMLWEAMGEGGWNSDVFQCIKPLAKTHPHLNTKWSWKLRVEVMLVME